MDEWTLSKVKKDNGDFWITRKNLYPVSEKENKDKYKYCTYLTCHYKPSTEEGFPSAQDNDAFEKIENEIATLCDGKHSVFVATAFMPKLKDFIIYTSNYDEISDLIEPIIKDYGQFKVEFGGHEDPAWKQYDSFS